MKPNICTYFDTNGLALQTLLQKNDKTIYDNSAHWQRSPLLSPTIVLQAKIAKGFQKYPPGYFKLPYHSLTFTSGKLLYMVPQKLSGTVAVKLSIIKCAWPLLNFLEYWSPFNASSGLCTRYNFWTWVTMGDIYIT